MEVRCFDGVVLALLLSRRCLMDYDRLGVLVAVVDSRLLFREIFVKAGLMYLDRQGHGMAVPSGRLVHVRLRWQVG